MQEGYYRRPLMWFEVLHGAAHREPADVSRNASSIVFFPATEHVTELGTRGSPSPTAAPRPLFPFGAAASTRALALPLPLPPEKAVTTSGPLPQEDKLPVRTTAFQGIHITGKTKVSRSRGVALKLFIVHSLLRAPGWLSPILFCHPATRAPVSLHPIS